MAVNIKNINIDGISKKESEKSESSFWDILNKDIQLFGKSFKEKKKERFFSELGILISSGTNIKTALEIIVEEQTNDKEKDFFKSIYNNVVNGMSLSEALKESNKFSPYDFYSLKIGEETGRINEILTELSNFYTKKLKQKRQLTSALSYPLLVTITAFGAVFFMMKYMVPMFVSVFDRFHGELPGLTKMIVALSGFVSNWLLYVTLIILSMSFFLYSSRKKEWNRKFFASIMLKIPILKDITRLIYLSRFFQSMSLLSGSHIPMLKALELVRHMIGFYQYEKAIAVIENDVLHGKLMHESMRKLDVFDNRIVSLIKVAEEVNKLDTIFEKLAKQYSEELEHKLGILSSMLEPIMIIIVGLMVGVILISMYLPMFKLSTSIY